MYDIIDIVIFVSSRIASRSFVYCLLRQNRLKTIEKITGNECTHRVSQKIVWKLQVLAISCHLPSRMPHVTFRSLFLSPRIMPSTYHGCNNPIRRINRLATHHIINITLFVYVRRCYSFFNLYFIPNSFVKFTHFRVV